MMLAREVVEEVPIAVGVADTPEGLSAIHSPGCAAAIWRRPPMPSCQSWIDALEPERLPKARVVLEPGTVREAVSRICDESGTPDCRERERLINDTAALADIFMITALKSTA